ncbi:MAG: hydrogenase maturation protease [Truepera sp.]|nr:hydrogenase maturation protease [Truepera sp.]
MSQTLLLGLGNILYGDEGLGVQMLHHLRRKYRFSAEVALRDGGVLGWSLIPEIVAARRVIIIDAVAGEVGAIYRFTGRDLLSGKQYGKLSSHEWGVPELLSAIELHGDLPEVIIVAMGVSPIMQLSLGLSEPVRARFRALEQTLLATLAGWGIAPQGVESATGPLEAEELVRHA